MSHPPSSSAVKEARISFGRRLRDIRKESGITARALAARAGWHESKCSKIESGTRPPAATITSPASSAPAREASLPRRLRRGKRPCSGLSGAGTRHVKARPAHAVAYQP
ncbi:helix-turn-helix domain-containing protein [Streptomyces sp. NPDC059080]|uniref:helix-turn-helix domain-containing protein n=1 Tax=Streptomyces sp. NPDC059080 TaxID=3346718 RepID=UPI0036B310DE